MSDPTTQPDPAVGQDTEETDPVTDEETVPNPRNPDLEPEGEGDVSAVSAQGRGIIPTEGEPDEPVDEDEPDGRDREDDEPLPEDEPA